MTEVDAHLWKFHKELSAGIVSLVLLGVVGRPAMLNAWMGLAGFVLVGLICFGLYTRAVRRLRREELLTNWR